MRSIQRQLTLRLALACCALWVLGSLAAYLALRAGLIAEFDRAHLTDVYSLTNLTEQSEAGLKFDATGEYLPTFQRENRPDYFQLWETDGAILYRSPALLDQPDLPRKSGSLIAPVIWNITLPDGLPGRALGVRFLPNEDEDAPRHPGSPPLTREAILVAAFHRQDLDARLRLLGTVLLLTGAAIGVATVTLVRLSVRRGLRPLTSLAEHAGAIDADSLQLRFPAEKLPGELLPIAQRLNELLARLEASFARERQFSADVAHELRTPIAELRSLAEVSLKWPDDPAGAEASLKEALAISLQMEAIATGLLALARCEARLTNIRPERIPLAELLRETSQSFEAKAGEKQLALQLEVPAENCWWTDRVLLRSIIHNLLANAVEYGEAGSAVRVEAGRNGAGDTLRISNLNRELAPDDLPHLFERFWRKDTARSSSTHAGLGLAVAKAYSQALGLELEAVLERPEVTFILSAASGRNES